MSIVHTSGKRKRAVARATLKAGKGVVKVNGQPVENFGSLQTQLKLQEPLLLIGDKASKVDVAVTTNGGGIQGQAVAARLAIARALAEWDEALKETFDNYDRMLLVADVRRKETCKPNVSKARKKRQKSYR